MSTLHRTNSEVSRVPADFRQAMMDKWSMTPSQKLERSNLTYYHAYRHYHKHLELIEMFLPTVIDNIKDAQTMARDVMEDAETEIERSWIVLISPAAWELANRAVWSTRMYLNLVMASSGQARAIAEAKRRSERNNSTQANGTPEAGQYHLYYRYERNLKDDPRVFVPMMQGFNIVRDDAKERKIMIDAGETPPSPISSRFDDILQKEDAIHLSQSVDKNVLNSTHGSSCMLKSNGDYDQDESPIDGETHAESGSTRYFIKEEIGSDYRDALDCDVSDKESPTTSSARRDTRCDMMRAILYSEPWTRIQVVPDSERSLFLHFARALPV